MPDVRRALAAVRDEFQAASRQGPKLFHAMYRYRDVRRIEPNKVPPHCGGPSIRVLLDGFEGAFYYREPGANFCQTQLTEFCRLAEAAGRCIDPLVLPPFPPDDRVHLRGLLDSHHDPVSQWMGAVYRLAWEHAGPLLRAEPSINGKWVGSELLYAHHLLDECTGGATWDVCVPLSPDVFLASALAIDIVREGAAQHGQSRVAVPEGSMNAEPPHYTLGQLISALESSETAYQDNRRTADRVEQDAGHNLTSTWWRIQAAALLFQPNPALHPGIDRIEALCDEWGTGWKAENVRKLRGKVCSKLGLGITEANAMTLDAVATTLSHALGRNNTGDGLSSCPSDLLEELPHYEAEQQPWFTPLPTAKPVSSEELTALADEIDVVIVTATDTEVEAVLRCLDPYPGRAVILRGFVEQETYYLGQFGACLAAVTKCRIGSLDSGGATLATQHAQRVWRPRALVMVGVALGKDPAKQRIADALVASQIISYEPQRVGETQVISHGAIPPANTTLLNRFENVPHWSFYRPDGSRCERHVGPLLSGEKLVDDPEFKAELFNRYPQAIGGEMEGVGLAAAAVRHGVPWILVKAICDWADGKKHARHQPLAAAAAVSLVHHVLSQADVLHGLEKPPQRQPAQPASSRNLKLHISPTWRKHRLCAQIRLFNSGPGPIYVESWWVAWGPKGAARGHNSIETVRGTLPVRLEEQSATELLVEVGGDIESLTGLGVFDGDDHLWLATEENLVTFRHGAITHRLPVIDSDKTEDTSLEGVTIHVAARANKPPGRPHERLEVTVRNDSDKPVVILGAQLAWTYTPPRQSPTRPGQPSVAEAGGSVTLSSISRTDPLGSGDAALFVLDEDMSCCLVELMRGDVRDEDISIEIATTGRLGWKETMDEIPSAVRFVAKGVVKRLSQSR